MLAATATPALPPVYQAWQERLAREFFGGRANQPVVLFLDRDGLAEFADPGVDPIRSLSAAVRSVVTLDRAAAAMFGEALRFESQWARGSQEEPPPTLPIIAVSVLAASEMHADVDGASTAYYVRLAQALLPDSTPAEVEALRAKLREQGAFNDVVKMWRRVDRWLSDSDGAHGISTIPENLPPHRVRIGYPLSQALVRRSDRSALTRFFDRLDLAASGVPAPEALIAQLRIWTQGRSLGFSQRFLEALDDPAVQDLLTALVHGLAVTWDGEVITADGRRRLEIRLALDIDRRDLWWVVPEVPSPPSDLLTGEADGLSFAVLLTPDDYSTMLNAEGLPAVTHGMMLNGLTATGPACVAAFRPAELMVFTENADAGAWVSTDAIRAFEEHVFVARPAMCSAVENVLTTAADPSWKSMDGGRVDGALAGTRLYYGIVFTDQEKIRIAQSTLPVGIAATLRFGATARPRLVNGLPLHRNLSRTTYLIGGEPDLELPVGAEPRMVLVGIDNEVDEIHATMFPFPVSRFIDHSVGMHLVEADDEALRFTVLQGAGDGVDPPHVAALSWTGGGLTRGEPRGEICGAWTQERVAVSVALVRRGASQTWLLDRRGRATPIDEPPAPDFVPDAGPMFYEVPRDRGEWLLQKRINRMDLTRLRASEPSFTSLSDQEYAIWRDAAYTVRTTDPLWRLYTAAWERVRER